MTTSEIPLATTLLLDMDGVLAEVSKSYRAAIVATCHEYGAKSVDFDTIADWKARGGCNNDWVLSLDLIHNDGRKDVTLEQVTETFEAFYQGTDGKPGLCDLETLIPTMDTLKELHKRCQGRMAVVTGRPQKDCNKFLKQHQIDGLFQTSVCMEDGPAKPDPFPVREACKRLGVSLPSQEVIMVGDTPDDIRAAVAAGCRGVGVTTPEAAVQAQQENRPHDTAKLSVAMKECGAETILPPGLTQLTEMFVPP